MARIIAVRVTERELARLDSLAKQTGRDRSKVIRLLLAQAKLSESPDIGLSEGQNQPQEERRYE